jgi:hypothetical protein
MVRHENEKHSGQKYFCPVPGCKHRGAVRRGRYKEHFLKHHPDLHDGGFLNFILLSLMANFLCSVNLEVPTNDPHWYRAPSPFDSQMSFGAKALGK